MTDGDLAAQRASMELFGWIHEGTTVHTSFWGEVDIGIEVYTCPQCGGLVGEGWLYTHMGYHEQNAPDVTRR